MDYSSNPDVASLQRLCEKMGGTKVVANAIGVNDQSIYQITSRRTLPSGREKGIGPALREKLNARYPGWNAPAPEDEIPDRLRAVLVTVGGLFRTIPEDQWGEALMDVAQVLQRGRRL